MPFLRLLARRRVDTSVLDARCAAADRMLAWHASAHAQAMDRRLAQPDSVTALRALEEAEELHYLAEWFQRRARRDLDRARRREHAAVALRRLVTPR